MSVEAIPRPNPRWEFGDRTRKIRRELGLSQAAFAELIGFGEKAVASWEAGGRPGDAVATAEKIEQATGYDAVWVLGVDRPRDPLGGNAYQPSTGGYLAGRFRKITGSDRTRASHTSPVRHLSPVAA